jgi:prepilin-type processing-associated H-X9-DG protein
LPQAFTLVELLAVIAILMLLAGLLAPALGKARGLAREAVCKANQRSVGQAAMMYARDSRECVPRGCGLGQEWFILFLPYLPGNGTREDFRRAKIYRCPSYPNPAQVVCYVVNSWDFRNPSDMVGREVSGPTSVLRVQEPWDTAYAADNESGPWRPILTGRNDPDKGRQDVWYPTHLPIYGNDRSQMYGRRVPADRHGDGASVLFFDGHVNHVPAARQTIRFWKTNRN